MQAASSLSSSSSSLEAHQRNDFQNAHVAEWETQNVRVLFGNYLTHNTNRICACWWIEDCCLLQGNRPFVTQVVAFCNDDIFCWFIIPKTVVDTFLHLRQSEPLAILCKTDVQNKYSYKRKETLWVCNNNRNCAFCLWYKSRYCHNLFVFKFVWENDWALINLCIPNLTP